MKRLLQALLRRRKLVWGGSAAALVVALVAVGAIVVPDLIQYRFLTPDQRTIVRSLGQPSRFTVAYLPLGTEGNYEITRTEVWYYPEHGQRISFVRGRVVSVDRIGDEPVAARYPSLDPWRFHVGMNREQVESVLGTTALAIDPAVEADGSDGAQVYVSGQAVFSVEKGKLVYFSSLGRQP